MTNTASATSTGSQRSSASTSATGGPSSGRPPPRSPTSSRSYTNWSYAHPRAIELATRIAGLAPGNLNRVFFTSGGSEAVESAWKLAKAYFKAKGEPARHKMVSRRLAYHGATMGALTATGLPPLRPPFEPLTPGGIHVPNTNSTAWPEDHDRCGRPTPSRRRSSSRGRRRSRRLSSSRCRTAGGSSCRPTATFERVREICDRHGVLLISDEVICAWGRLGYMFGCSATATSRT